MTSRVSFLEDSPPVRRLLDGASLMSEKLAQQLHSQGVDPLRVPRFSVLRLRDQDAAGGSLLPRQVKRQAMVASCKTADGEVPGQFTLGRLALAPHHAQVVEPEPAAPGGELLRPSVSCVALPCFP